MRRFYALCEVSVWYHPRIWMESYKPQLDPRLENYKLRAHEQKTILSTKISYLTLFFIGTSQSHILRYWSEFCLRGLRKQNLSHGRSSAARIRTGYLSYGMRISLIMTAVSVDLTVTELRSLQFISLTSMLTLPIYQLSSLPGGPCTRISPINSNRRFSLRSSGQYPPAPLQAHTLRCDI